MAKRRNTGSGTLIGLDKKGKTPQEPQPDPSYKNRSLYQYDAAAAKDAEAKRQLEYTFLANYSQV